MPCRWNASHSSGRAADGAEAEPAAVRPVQRPPGAERRQPAHPSAAAAGAAAAGQRPRDGSPGHAAAFPAATAGRGSSSSGSDPGEDPAAERGPGLGSAAGPAAAAGATSDPRARADTEPSVTATSYNTAAGL